MVTSGSRNHTRQRLKKQKMAAGWSTSIYKTSLWSFQRCSLQRAAFMTTFMWWIKWNSGICSSKKNKSTFSCFLIPKRSLIVWFGRFFIPFLLKKGFLHLPGLNPRDLACTYAKEPVVHIKKITRHILCPNRFWTNSIVRKQKVNIWVICCGTAT